MKKLIAIIFISVVLMLAGYLVYRYFFYTCCAPNPNRIDKLIDTAQ